MAWVYLWIAGVLEICWAIGLKQTEGFTRLWPSVVTFVLMIASFFALARAVTSIPIGTAYAVWTGIGAVGTAILGIFLYQEPASAPRLACVAMVVVGVVGLKVTAKEDSPKTDPRPPVIERSCS